MLRIKIFEFNPFGENTIIVYDDVTLETAVIDPGMMQPREFDAFDRFIEDNRLNVKHLINTHIHVDHVAADTYVTKKYGIGLSASDLDGFLAVRVAEQARMFHLNVAVPSEIEIAKPLSDGDRITIGSEEIDILAVPGHSPGSIALYSSGQKFVIVGDVLFRLSIGRTDLPGGNFQQLLDSIKTKLFTLPDDTEVYPGHGPSTTIGYERKRNPYLQNL